MSLANPVYDISSGGGSQSTITVIHDEDAVAGGGGVEKSYVFSPGDLIFQGAVIKGFSVSCTFTGTGSVDFLLNSVIIRSYTIDTSGSIFTAYMVVTNPSGPNTVGIDVSAGATITKVDIVARIVEL